MVGTQLGSVFLFCASVKIFTQKSAFWITFSGVCYLRQRLWAFLGLSCVLLSTSLIIGDSYMPPAREGHLSPPSCAWTLGCPVYVTGSADLYCIS